MASKSDLTARMEPFDSFWEAPEDIEKGYDTFGEFYKHNYLKRFSGDKLSNILVIGCGPGYMVDLLNKNGYSNVLGIDSMKEKVDQAKKRKLNCRVARAFDFLGKNKKPYDMIVCEQEINHMTKDEILSFLRLCHNNLRSGGKLVIHSLNGANPIVGSENLALNFDHYNAFTEQSLVQVLKYCNFENIRIIPLKLYVFYGNPLNYVGIIVDKLFTLFFTFCFRLYGKSNKIFSKKIGAICEKPM